MFKKMFLGTILVFVMCVLTHAQIGPELQKVSVNIFCSDSYGGGSVQGSGTLIMGKVDDKEMSWILTCNHVVKDLRKVSTIIDGEGDEKKQVRY